MNLGIITYNTNHLKTEQVVERLLRLPAPPSIGLIALPFTQRPARNVQFAHRPDQTAAPTTVDLARANGLSFVEWSGKDPLPEFDLYMITGAGLLAPEAIVGKRIINSHPGIIPMMRGLDSFKWAILEGKELGVTLHWIDEGVDSGEAIAIQTTPVYSSDTLESLARRHYEIEIEMMASFQRLLEHGDPASYAEGPAHMRMPADKETEMIAGFEAYKARFAR